MPDIIGDVLERLAAIDPGISPQVLDRAEYLVRERWGNQRVRIPSLPSRQKELGVRLGYLDPATLPKTTRWRYTR